MQGLGSGERGCGSLDRPPLASVSESREAYSPEQPRRDEARMPWVFRVYKACPIDTSEVDSAFGRTLDYKDHGSQITGDGI